MGLVRLRLIATKPRCGFVALTTPLTKAFSVKRKVALAWLMPKDTKAVATLKESNQASLPVGIRPLWHIASILGFYRYVGSHAMFGFRLADNGTGD